MSSFNQGWWHNSTTSQNMGSGEMESTPGSSSFPPSTWQPLFDLNFDSQMEDEPEDHSGNDMHAHVESETQTLHEIGEMWNKQECIKRVWNMSEVAILLDARKQDWIAYGPGMVGTRALHLPYNQRWAAIAEKCWIQGVLRSSQQCLDKWEALRSDWQKVWDYEKNIPRSQKSYWEMDSGKMKALKTKAVVHKDIYDNIASWLPSSSRSTDPIEIIDTSNNEEQSKDQGDDSTRAFDPSSTGKRRQSLPIVSDALATAMESSRKRTIEAMVAGEERADKRHKEFMAFVAKKHAGVMLLQQQSLNMQVPSNEKMHEIEREKLAATKEANEGFVHALLSISKAMAGIHENL